MKLMSSLLLCALAVLLPQALGVKTRVASDIKRDSTKIIETPIARKTVWFSEKIPSMMALKTLYRAMLMDEECFMCAKCIKKSIYSFNHKNIIKTSASNYLSSGDAQNDIIDNYHQYKTYRLKRDSETTALPYTVSSQVTKATNVAVTEYSTDGQVYAIKIRGNNSANAYKHTESCHVYDIKEHYPCDTPKADFIFAAAQRKANKASKNLIRSLPTTTQSQREEKEEILNAPKGLAEPFLTSIEELYN